MKTVADIMTTKVVSLKETDNLHQGRMLMKEHSIRHLPVVSESSGEFVGLITQRDILNNAFNVVEKYGFSKLKKREEATQISEVMTADCPTIESDVSLRDAGQYFIDHKHSCLPVVDNGQLTGMLTSVDFVKLSVYLLDD